MAEGGQQESWTKIRGKREKAQWEWKSTLSKQSLMEPEWKREDWDLFSPVLLISHLFYKMVGFVWIL